MHYRLKLLVLCLPTLYNSFVACCTITTLCATPQTETLTLSESVNTTQQSHYATMSLQLQNNSKIKVELCASTGVAAGIIYIDGNRDPLSLSTFLAMCETSSMLASHRQSIEQFFKERSRK